MSYLPDREQLRTTFDSAAQLYHDARPEYPAELYDELLLLAGLSPGDRVLEVGCGTGKATVPFASRGFRITCVELGANLSAVARSMLAEYPATEVVTGAFETWRPAEARFDLVFAATAWHWLEPVLRYERAWELLRPGGHLALWGATHVFPVGGDPFFRDIQPVYEEIVEGLPPRADYPEPGRLPDSSAEILASGRFEDVQVRQFDWETSYDAAGYIRLLNTFSDHIAMQPWQRDRLYGEIRRRLAARPGGRLRRHWGAVLHVARRRAVP